MARETRSGRSCRVRQEGSRARGGRGRGRVSQLGWRRARTVHALWQGNWLRGRSSVRHGSQRRLWRLAAGGGVPRGDAAEPSRKQKWRAARALHRSPGGRLEREMARWADVDGPSPPSAHRWIASHPLQTAHRQSRQGRASGWRQLWISQIAPDGISPSCAFRVAVIRCEPVRP